ncbi:MAG TPA: hypothetical protein DCM71_27030 [Runella sp.]|nr:hypothetical protein [Runella sp.]
MDKDLLVEKLKILFQQEKEITIDAFGLAPAYGGMVSNSFVLGVSAPSMAGDEQPDKIQKIIGLLFSGLKPEERRWIDRVRVYDNVRELKKQAQNDFEEISNNNDSYVSFETELFKLEAV